jgi:hypothetical protein
VMNGIERYLKILKSEIKMTYKEKIIILSQIGVETASYEDLVESYYSRQYKYYSRLSTSDLNAEFDKIRDPMEDFR